VKVKNFCLILIFVRDRGTEAEQATMAVAVPFPRFYCLLTMFGQS